MATTWQGLALCHDLTLGVRMAFIAESLISQIIDKAAMSFVVGAVMAVFVWPFRKVRKEWIALKNEQSLIHQELITQRTNCLATLAQQGDRQVELLGKMSGTLDNIALSQAEMVGYLASAPRVR